MVVRGWAARSVNGRAAHACHPGRLSHPGGLSQPSRLSYPSQLWRPMLISRIWRLATQATRSRS